MKHPFRFRSILLPAISFLALLVIVLVMPSISSGYVDEERNPLLNELEKVFTARNTNIKHVAVLDLQAFNYGQARYVLVGWGISEDRSFNGDFNDELFGVFVVNSELTRIEETLEIMPTPRWLDYELLIESVTADSVVVVGLGATYDDSPIRRAYKWEPFE
ncbi:MAG: hypothetical protein BA863_12115 [Desulfovibrio sp. S3730MH75]|nr:MAG: hypothetical protein BA863_12115 [Desulfovibrio sp. S3730MH75]